MIADSSPLPLPPAVEGAAGAPPPSSCRCLSTRSLRRSAARVSGWNGLGMSSSKISLS